MILKYIANDAKYAVKNLTINKFRLRGNHWLRYDAFPTCYACPVDPIEELMAVWGPGNECSIAFVCNDAETFMCLFWVRGEKKPSETSALHQKLRMPS
jgi:hypothetical protein